MKTRKRKSEDKDDLGDSDVGDGQGSQLYRLDKHTTDSGCYGSARLTLF